MTSVSSSVAKKPIVNGSSIATELETEVIYNINSVPCISNAQARILMRNNNIDITSRQQQDHHDDDDSNEVSFEGNDPLQKYKMKRSLTLRTPRQDWIWAFTGSSSSTVDSNDERENNNNQNNNSFVFVPTNSPEIASDVASLVS